MKSILELDIPWLFMAGGGILLVLDLLLGFFAYGILRRKFKKIVLKEAKETEKESGSRIIQARMRALEEEFKAKVKEEINRSKTEEILKLHRRALKKLLK